jgi:hypothetical protein
VQTVPDDAEPADGGGAWAGRDFAWG